MHPNSLKNLKPPYKPGESGNPNGRPRKVITQALLDHLDKTKIGHFNLPEGRTLLDVILESIIRNLMAGNAKTIADLWERFEGKVADEALGATDHPLVQAIQTFAEEAKKLGDEGKRKRDSGKAKAPRKTGG